MAHRQPQIDATPHTADLTLVSRPSEMQVPSTENSKNLMSRRKRKTRAGVVRLSPQRAAAVCTLVQRVGQHATVNDGSEHRYSLYYQ
jgi:hypothetical protein